LSSTLSPPNFRPNQINLTEKLFNAADAGDPEWILQVAKMGTDVNAKDENDNGRTCAHKAARGGHDQALRFAACVIPQRPSPLRSDVMAPWCATSLVSAQDSVELAM
jgi:hypothetical protein